MEAEFDADIRTCPGCKGNVSHHAKDTVYAFFEYWHQHCFVCKSCAKAFRTGERPYKGDDGLTYHEECLNAVIQAKKEKGTFVVDDEPKLYFTNFLRGEMTPDHLAECMAMNADRWFAAKARGQDPKAPSPQREQLKRKPTSSKHLVAEEAEGVDVAAELSRPH